MQNNLPVLLLKDLIILPDQEIKLEITNENSKNIINISKNCFDSMLLVIPNKGNSYNDIDPNDLLRISVKAEITSVLELPNGNKRVMLLGKQRCKNVSFTPNDENPSILMSKYKNISDIDITDNEAEALKRKLKTSLKKYIKMNSKASNSILSRITNTMPLGLLTDIIAPFLFLSYDIKLELMVESDPIKRARVLIELLQREIEILSLENKIDNDLKKGLDDSQREFLLKEKINLIKKELGEKSGKDEDVEYLTNLLNNATLPESIYDRVVKEIKKYEIISELSPEATTLRTYIEMLINLPWYNQTVDETDIRVIKNKLDSTHYSYKDAKERIVEYAYLKQINPDIKIPIICLIGPPGVGKSTFAASIASAMNRKFVKISVGGLSDSAELIGHRKTYVGSSPGKIIDAFLRVKCNNPLILIDEVDKMISDYKGNPTATLLDILDTSLNNNFVDSYIEEPFDLSNTFFVLTANNVRDIPAELLDRLEIIELNSYTDFDKQQIFKKYLLPDVLSTYKVKSNDILFSDSVIKNIIKYYTVESGVRELKRCIDALVRKILMNDEVLPLRVNNDILIKYLGNYKYKDVEYKHWSKGCVNCLAVTNHGGIVMPVEVTFRPDGNKVTGSVGETMFESVLVINSYLFNNSRIFNLDLDLFNRPLHIHYVDASSQKNGPSGSLSTATAMLSLYKNKVIPRDIAMTGELTLNGNVLPIGLVKEKIIAAYNNKIKTIYIPKANEQDLSDVPDRIKEKICIKLVTNYRQIYEDLFL